MFLDKLVRLVLPRQDRFFVLLEGIAGVMIRVSAEFAALETASGVAAYEAIAGRIKPMETEADKLCHDVYHELDNSFVTPIDREDLAHLTKALDDVIDAMDHAAAFAALFRFESLTEPMRQLIRITVKAAAELSKGVHNIRHFTNPDSIRDATIAVHTLENEGDAVFRKAIAALFSDGIDARELVRQKDMLSTLEDGIDRCEDAMDVIRSVIVKNG